MIGRPTMTPLERAAWVYLARTGELSQYLGYAEKTWHARLAEVGAMLRNAVVSPGGPAGGVLGCDPVSQTTETNP